MGAKPLTIYLSTCSVPTIPSSRLTSRLGVVDLCNGGGQGKAGACIDSQECYQIMLQLHLIHVLLRIIT